MADLKKSQRSYFDVVEARFQIVARDPRVLAFLASSMNYVSNIRIEALKLETEIASFRARRKTKVKTGTPT